MTTKERIRAAALLLFNERGTDTVTVRHIAAETGISHGNLCYHYSNTDAIVESLYDQLVDQLSARIDAVVHVDSLTLSVLKALANETICVFYEYRFLFLDFAGIMRRLPALREKYRVLVGQRKAVFLQLLGQLRVNGLLRPELYPDQDNDLLEQLFILGDFWLASAAILDEGTEAQRVTHYQRVVRSLLVPMLTGSGLDEWHRT